ncbi:hypothetical protein J2S19_004804 [Metabacillus malikii]|uniref:Histidine kinase n=1 Tax=Metabacillus malikii TaxID=1504265 RepID=A0ABT9ZMD8_9BACI|nr:hypothetical protein [Metabacillus malikii]
MKKKFTTRVFIQLVLVIISIALPVLLRLVFNGPPEVLNIIYLGTLILLSIIPRWYIYWIMLVVSWFVIYFTETYSTMPVPPSTIAFSNVIPSGILLFFVT